MVSRWLPIAMLVGACGSVEPDALRDGGLDAASDARTGATDAMSTAVAFKGTLDATQPVTFGGPYNGLNYCFYTITLKQLELDLGITAAGQVMTGHAQDLNVEGNDPTVCPNGVIPANIATYTLQAVKTAGSALQLSFQGVAGNQPDASLDVTLTKAGASYSAEMVFHRIDEVAPFDWSVVTTVGVTPP